MIDNRYRFYYLIQVLISLILLIFLNSSQIKSPFHVWFIQFSRYVLSILKMHRILILIFMSVYLNFNWLLLNVLFVLIITHTLVSTLIICFVILYKHSSLSMYYPQIHFKQQMSMIKHLNVNLCSNQYYALQHLIFFMNFQILALKFAD